MSTSASAAQIGTRPAARLSDRSRLVLLALVAAALAAAYITVGAGGMWEYVLPRRTARILAMVLSGTAVAASTVIFQTLTNNRILSPSVMGLDSLYMLVQTAIVFVFGTTHRIAQSPNFNFAVSAGLMLAFSAVMYRVFFARERGNIFFMLLVGIVFGTFFQSASSFLQVLIDPNEFLVVQSRMFASFNNVKTNLLAVAGGAIVLSYLVFRPYVKYLDVLALGKEHAINLGVDYPRVVRRLLMAVFVLVSVATALVGPITFLGIIVANLAYELLRTYRRAPIIVAASLVSVIALVGGQLIVERVFAYSTTLSVVINLVGGIYFLHLILKERTA